MPKKRCYGNISGLPLEINDSPTYVRADNAKQAMYFEKGTRNYCRPYKAKRIKSHGLAGGIPSYKVYFKCVCR